MGLYVDTSNSSKRYYGLDNLDQKIEKYLNYDNGFFIELGANNGVTQSNTLYFEKFRNWTGILIEPVLHNFLLCRANRSKRTKIFCCACTSFEYKQRFVEIFFSDIMSIASGLESDIPNPIDHAVEGMKFCSNPITEMISFGAIARSLDSLLQEAGAPNIIDLLSLDVEGAEIEVLKGIDFNSYQFKYILVESRSFDKLNLFLSSKSYLFVDKLSHWDYLFRNNS
jgi:FkbM family methyltransferase